MLVKDSLGIPPEGRQTLCMRLAIVEVRAQARPSATLLVTFRSEDGRRTFMKRAARAAAEKSTGQLLLYNTLGRIASRIPLDKVLQIRCN